MVTIHPRCFLHITDAVFDYAPPASLVVMAQTCREWRHRVLSRYHHILDLRVLKTPLNLPTDFAYFATPHGTAGGRIEEVLHRSELALLAGSKVLDITEMHPFENYGFPLDLDLDLDTVRYHWGLPDQEAIPARQMVCQGEIMLHSDPNSAVKHVVVHGTESTNGVYPFARLWGLTGLERLTIIFEYMPLWLEQYDRTDSESDSDSFSVIGPYDPDYPPKKRLHMIRDLIAAAENHDATIVLVGTERWSSDAFDGLELGIKREYDTDKSERTRHRRIVLATLDAYRRSIGEKEWAVQTDWSHPLTP